MSEISRRTAIGMVAATTASIACRKEPAAANPSTGPASTTISGMKRLLGRTGVEVEAVSLGGEGSLRTTGNDEAAVATIVEALKLGVRYCDTAPAYEQSQDYYRKAFAQIPGSRAKVFLASKTHRRTRDTALALLDDSLKRLGTDHLDLWQLHDLREQADLDQIFGKGGAIEAAEVAKKDGRIRFLGITGHHDPSILVEAMRRYPFDTVLCALNPSDPARLSFVKSVVPEARTLGMGVIGMKIFGRGRILDDGAASIDELVSYASSFADTSIIGCMSPKEVRLNLEAGRRVKEMSAGDRQALETRLLPRAARYAYYKAEA